MALLLKCSLFVLVAFSLAVSERCFVRNVFSVVFSGITDQVWLFPEVVLSSDTRVKVGQQLKIQKKKIGTFYVDAVVEVGVSI